MEFGNAIRYLRDSPEANRVLLLSEVASGTFLPFTRITAHSEFTSYGISTYAWNYPWGFTGGGWLLCRITLKCLKGYGSRTSWFPETVTLVLVILDPLAPRR